MTSEKIPSTKKPEAPSSAVETAEASYSSEIVEKVENSFSPENKGFFNRISEGAKEMAHSAYEGLYKIPGVNKVVGKMEIAYNQFWIDKNEEKKAGLRDKLNGFDRKTSALDKSKSDAEDLMRRMKIEDKNIPTGSLLLKLKEWDKQKADLLNKRDAVQTKFEARENKVKLFTNERDRIADKLIGHYNEKLGPLEKNLSDLNTSRDELELTFAVAEMRHRDKTVELDKLDKEKTRLEGLLRETGMSDRQIKDFESVKYMDESIASGREEIRLEKELLAKKEREIEIKIAKAEEKANPFRDKKNEFIRVKDSRPIDMGVKPREKVEEHEDREKINIHERHKGINKDEAKDVVPKVGGLAQWVSQGAVQFEKPMRIVDITPDPVSGEMYVFFEGSNVGVRLSEVESAERGDEVEEAEKKLEELDKDKEKLSTLDYIIKWNDFLKGKYKKEALAEIVEPKDFLKATRLSGDYKLEFADFKKLMFKYLKYKKISSREKFTRDINGFEKSIGVQE